MRRRSRASSKLAKARSRKTVKRRTTSKDVRRPSSSARPKIGAAQLARERDEALEQLSGASEVLKVIGSSSGDLKPVFQTMLAKAVGLCQAKFGVLWLREGDRFRSVALHNVPVSQRQAREREPLVQFGPHSGSGRAIRTKRAVHIPDLMNDEGYLKRDPRLISLVETGGARAAVFTPLLKDNEVIGILVLFRQEVGPFTDKQMALVENFATQAVIAIENARLLNELRELLQQQTATADVLKVISTSPGELEPVFQAMLENAVRICEAKFGTLFRFEGDAYRAVATHNAPQELMDEYGRHGLRQPTPGGILDRMLRTKQVCHTADYAAEFVHGTAARFGGARSIVCVPMVKDNVLIGAFSIYRQEVRPFTDKQIALLENFGAQAVIAIENTRLLNELRHRTSDLTESLEQQTATSEVLRVISSSPGELEPVFQAMLTNAMRICEAKFGHLLLYDGESFHPAHLGDVPAAYREIWERGPLRPNPKTAIGRIAETKQVIQIPDIKADPAYAEGEPLRVATVEIAGARTLLGVPMFKESQLVGAIIIYRQEVRPFTDKQIELVKNFASQAVIAIENTRLLNELRQSLEQQTATADVLRVISSSPGELEPVFEAMLTNAMRLCEAKFGVLYLHDEGRLRFGAAT